MITSLGKQSLLGIEITNSTSKEILEYIIDFLQSNKKPIYVVTPNPEIIVRATKNKAFREILNNAELALPDGVGVLLGGQIVGKPFQERVTGTDFIEAICKRVVNESKSDVRKPITMGFLGAGPNVALKASECLSKKYPGLRVAFAGEEWPTSQPSEPLDILFVAFGVPKQEEWMAEHVGNIPVRVMIGVGGALDYLSGRVPRAPKVLRSAGLEWLYRLIREPWRAKRQLALVEYIWLILESKIRNSNIETRNNTK